jgi:hypothetical protein
MQLQYKVELSSMDAGVSIFMEDSDLESPYII